MTTDSDFGVLIRLRDTTDAWIGISDWKHKPADVGIDGKTWRRLEQDGLVESRGLGCRVSIVGWMRMMYAAGVDPVDSRLSKEEADVRITEWRQRILRSTIAA